MSDEPEAVERPVLRVVRGEPDATEIAALVAVVAASGGGDPAPRRARSAWADPARSLRHALPAGGWRATYAPR
ncbi:MAG: acyl-CoA carboxylase subunit epsilon [Frankiales bacterium]|nr:acyl-CoA carboxylase subunit epsilon [Frankiales bacterium]